MNNYEKLLEYSWSLDIVDTHEHLIREDVWKNESGDILSDWLKMYFSCDLISAGLSHKELETVRDSFSKKNYSRKVENPGTLLACSTKYRLWAFFGYSSKRSLWN